MQVGWGKVGNFCQRTNLWLRRTTAANLCSSTMVDDHDGAALAE